MRLLMLALAMAGALGATQAQNASRIDYQAPDFGKNLNMLCNKETAAAGDMQEFMQMVHKAFATEHLWLGAINFQFPMSGSWLRLYNHAQLKALRPLLFKDPKQVEAIFEQAMPAFQQQFGRMTENERADYLEFLRDGLDYAKNFDLEREKAELYQIEIVNYGSFRDRKGDLQAFIYRRIAGGDISKADCVRYLERAVQKFEATPQKDPENPLRNYVILPNYDRDGKPMGLYYGIIYQNSKRSQRRPLFYRQNNQFLPIPGGPSLYSAHQIGDSELLLTENEAHIYDIYLCPLASDAANPNAMPQPPLGGFKSKPNISQITPQLLSINTHTYIVADKNKPIEVHTIPPAQQNPLGLYIVRLKDGTPRLLSQSTRLESFAPQADKIALAPNSLNFWLAKEATIIYANSAQAYSFDTLNLGYVPDSIRAVGSLLRVWRQQKSEVIYHTIRLGKLSPHLAATLADLGMKINHLQTFIDQNGRWGAFDLESNHIAIAPAYKSLRPDTDNSRLIAQTMDGKYGIIGFDGKIILDFNYTALEPVALADEQAYIVSKTAPAHDLAELEKYPENPNFGIIDIEGTDRLAQKYYYIYYITPTLALVGQKDKKGVRYAIFNTETYKFASKFDYPATTRADTFYTTDPKTFDEIEVVRRYPQMPNVLVPNYDGTTEEAIAKYGGFLLRSAKSWQLIDFYGKKMNTPACDSLAFSPIVAHFEFHKGDKFGLIDAEGSIIVPAQYKHIYKVEETDLYFASLTPQGINAKYTLFRHAKALYPKPFDSHQEKVIVFDPETFEEQPQIRYCAPALCREFGPKIYVLYRDSLAGLYDAEGGQILPHTFQQILIFQYQNKLKALAVRQNDKWALFSPEGKPLTDFIYTRISYYPDHKIMAILPDDTVIDITDKIK